MRRQSAHCDFSLEGEVRYSRYNDPHRSNGTTQTREDTRYRGPIRLGRELGNGLAAFGEARHTVNKSSLTGDPFTGCQYTKTYYMVGLDQWF